jgi:hypothetical protein
MCRPWELKYLLSPEDRKLKKEYEVEVERIRQEAIHIIKDSEAKDAVAFEMYKRGRALLPFLRLTKSICNNYRQKLEAARHKAVLLERMTITEVKESLSGATDRPAEVLSAENMAIVQNVLAANKKLVGLSRLQDDVEKSTVQDRERIMTSQEDLRSNRGTYRKKQFIPNPIMMVSRRSSSLPENDTLPFLLSRKKSYGTNTVISTTVREPISDEC